MTKRDEPPQIVRGVVAQNIRTLMEARRELERAKTLSHSVAARISGFCGTMGFVGLQLVLIGSWVVVNLGALPFVRPFDPFPFQMLAVVTSAESIFIATFILICQNRQASTARRREDLHLQVSLLAEHKATHVLHLLHSIAARVGVPPDETQNTDELRADVTPEHVLAEIERLESEPEVRLDDEGEGRPLRAP
jgi:uncharacterized membrane protein